jgi:hypothetical protein
MRRPAQQPARSSNTESGELESMGWSGAGRAGAIVVQLRAGHNGKRMHETCVLSGKKSVKRACAPVDERGGGGARLRQRRSSRFGIAKRAAKATRAPDVAATLSLPRLPAAIGLLVRHRIAAMALFFVFCAGQ